MSKITQKWVEILMPFTSNYGSRLSGTELARFSGIPQQIASRQLNDLVKQGILEYITQGRNRLYHFYHSRQSTKNVYEIIENHRGIIFQQKSREAFTIVSESMKCAESVIIFGSYSSYTFDKDHDIDVVLVGECDKNRIRDIKRKQAVHVNEHCVPDDEFAKLLRTKIPLAIEILKNTSYSATCRGLLMYFWRQPHERYRADV